jgi:hypothetical protein
MGSILQGMDDTLYEGDITNVKEKFATGVVNTINEVFKDDCQFGVFTPAEPAYYRMPRWYVNNTMRQILDHFLPEVLLDHNFDFTEDEYNLFMNRQSRFVQCVTTDTKRCIFFDKFYKWLIKEVPNRICGPETEFFKATWNPLSWGSQYQNAQTNTQHLVEVMSQNITQSINDKILKEMQADTGCRHYKHYNHKIL